MNIAFFRLVVAVSLVGLSSSGMAEDKNGIRLMVTKKTLDRADGKPGYSREIDRTMALKAALKNISTKDLGEGKIECIILVRRWATETGSTERYTKELKLDPMKTAQELELLVGEYHIGGHMHGNLDYHVDQVAGWKLTVEHAGKRTEFLSSPQFESLNKRATEARN
jgi:hypothetical protein